MCTRLRLYIRVRTHARESPGSGGLVRHVRRTGDYISTRARERTSAKSERAVRHALTYIHRPPPLAPSFGRAFAYSPPWDALRARRSALNLSRSDRSSRELSRADSTGRTARSVLRSSFPSADALVGPRFRRFSIQFNHQLARTPTES